MDEELDEIIEHIKRIRELYQNGKFTLSNAELFKIEEMVDDYRRIEL